MHALQAELSQFAQVVVSGDTPSERLAASLNYSVQTGIEVYRNNYRGNLQDALSGAYPVIEQLVGKEFFRMMARHFIEQTPPRKSDLARYGGELSGFLANFAAARELVYLPDVATLEWACHCAYFAPDETVLDLARLAQVEADCYSNLVFRIHSAARIVRSRYPITAIWQAHQPDFNTDDFHIDLDSDPSIALVHRKHDIVAVREYGQADALWLQSVMAGKKLGNATAVTQEHYPNFDLQTALRQLFELDILVGFTLEEI